MRDAKERESGEEPVTPVGPALVDAGLLVPAFAAVRRAGGDPDRVLASAGYDFALDPKALPKLREADMRRILDACASETRDPLFGLRIPREIAPGSFGVAQYASWTAETVGDGLATIARFTHLIDGVTRVTCERTDNEVAFVVRGLEPESLGIHGALTFLGMTVRWIQETTLRPFTPACAWTAQEPADAGKLREAIGTRAYQVLGSSTGLVIPPEVAGLRLRTADPALHEILCEHAELLSTRLLATRNYRGVLQEIVRQQFLDAEEVSVSTAARKLGTSVRTFQRRLLVERSSFHDVVDTVRAELAYQMLARGEHSVADVAYALQYSDVSAFIRAFRRWTGTTPGDVLRASERPPGGVVASRYRSRRPLAG